MPFGLFQPPSHSKKKNYIFQEGTIGKGGFSIVRKAKWNGGDKTSKTSKDVAVKIVLKTAIKRIDNYLAILDWLTSHSTSHPHVITTYDWFESSTKWYITFELAQGGELFDRISASPYSEADGKEAAKALIDAVGYCHEQGMVHRDIKLENFLFRGQDPKDFVLSDFGIAEVLKDPKEQEKLFEICGTPGYTAPEIYKSMGYDRKCDVYSAGMVIYAMLTAWSPFSSSTSEGLVAETLKGDIKFPKSRWSAISSECKDLIKTLLTMDPQNRPSAREALLHPWFLSPTSPSPNERSQASLAPPEEEGASLKKVPTIMSQEHPIVRRLTTHGSESFKKDHK